MEKVKHPKHYGGDTVYEVIKVLEAHLTPEEFIGALKFNYLKYLLRAGKKQGEERQSDFDKALFYLNYENDFRNRTLINKTGEQRVPDLVKKLTLKGIYK